MSDTTDVPTILVPVAVSDGETIPPGVVDLLADVETLLLGYRDLPEQTPPGQARMQFEEQGEKLLADLAEPFRAAGGAVRTRLVFTQDRTKTIERVAREEHCDGTLLVQPAPVVDHLYLALWNAADAARLGQVASHLVGSHTREVSLRSLDRGNGDEAADAAALQTVADDLLSAGVPTAAIDRQTIETDSVVRTVTEDAGDADVVVIPEPSGSLTQFVFGDIEDRIAATLLVPVLVVHSEREEPAPAGGTESRNSEQSTES